MKNEEAMKIFKDTLYNRTELYAGYDDCRDALKIAIVAIEKQRQKKPLVYKAHPRSIYLCPLCGSNFVDRAGIVMNYCNNCGQALDWSEVE